MNNFKDIILFILYVEKESLFFIIVIITKYFSIIELNLQNILNIE